VSGGQRLTVVVCKGPVCGEQRGSAALTAHLEATLDARGLRDRVDVVEEVCLGHCLRGPNVLVYPQAAGGADEGVARFSTGAVLYNRMTVEELERVVEKHLVGGMAVRIFTNRPPTR
jgi:(2Fe-2S) ferredoxin